jgi:hypothetical protein
MRRIEESGLDKVILAKMHCIVRMCSDTIYNKEVWRESKKDI